MADPEMDAFDKLPKWARDILNESDRKFKASEILAGVQNGGIDRNNLPVMMAMKLNAERRAKQRGY